MAGRLQLSFQQTTNMSVRLSSQRRQSKLTFTEGVQCTVQIRREGGKVLLYLGVA